MKKVLFYLLLISLVFFNFQFAKAETEVKGPSCSTANSGDYYLWSESSFTTISESFTTTLEQITKVSVRAYSLNSFSGEVTAAIYTTPGYQMIGNTTRTFTNMTADVVDHEFVFSSPLYLAADQQFELVLYLPNAMATTGTFYWRTTDNPACYSGGNAKTNSINDFPLIDMGFAIWGYEVTIPGPTTSSATSTSTPTLTSTPASTTASTTTQTQDTTQSAAETTATPTASSSTTSETQSTQTQSSTSSTTSSSESQTTANTQGSAALDTTNVDSAIQSPTKLKVDLNADKKSAKLTWEKSKSDDISGYKIFRSEDKNKGYKIIETLAKDKLEYTDDKDFKSNATYYYFVRAYKDTKQSGNSNIVEVKVAENKVETNVTATPVATTTSLSPTVTTSTSKAPIAPKPVKKSSAKLIIVIILSLVTISGVTYFILKKKGIKLDLKKLWPSKKIIE